MNSHAIICDEGKIWCHLVCIIPKMTLEYFSMDDDDVQWKCIICTQNEIADLLVRQYLTYTLTKLLTKVYKYIEYNYLYIVNRYSNLQAYRLLMD